MKSLPDMSSTITARFQWIVSGTLVLVFALALSPVIGLVIVLWAWVTSMKEGWEELSRPAEGEPKEDGDDGE